MTRTNPILQGMLGSLIISSLIILIASLLHAGYWRTGYGMALFASLETLRLWRLKR